MSFSAAVVISQNLLEAKPTDDVGVSIPGSGSRLSSEQMGHGEYARLEDGLIGEERSPETLSCHQKSYESRRVINLHEITNRCSDIHPRRKMSSE